MSVPWFIPSSNLILLFVPVFIYKPTETLVTAGTSAINRIPSPSAYGGRTGYMRCIHFNSKAADLRLKVKTQGQRSRSKVKVSG